MIIGIGTDLIEIERIEKACKRGSFLIRCFSLKERELIKENYTIAADNFAVKEAVSKVFGTGISGLELSEIEVLREESGKPYVVLSGNALKVAEERGISKIHVSISNDKTYSIAFAVGEGE